MEKKQRHIVIYAGNLKFPNNNAAAQRVSANVKLIEKLEYDVICVGCTQEEKFLEYQQNNVRYFNQKDDKVFKLKFYLSSAFLKTVIDNYKEEIYTVVLYNYPAFSSVSIMKKCRKLNIKVVSDITEWYEAIGIFGLKFLDTQWRMKKILPRMDGIIAISQFLYDYYLPFTKCVKIPPLIDYEQEKWKKLKLPELTSELTLIYAGSPGKTKDCLSKMIKVFVAASLEMPNKNVLFKIVGITKEEYQKSRTDALKTIPSNVIFEGRKKHDELLQEIANSDFSFFLRDISLVTSAGFPTKFSESIACGTPVITNETSDLKKYLVQGETGFFLEEGSMEKQLKEILNLPRNEINRMKKNCLKNREFDYTNYIAEMQRFFESLEC